MRPATEPPALDALRQALADLAAAQQWRALAETWSASGLIDPTAAQRALTEADRDLARAHQRLAHLRHQVQRAPFEGGAHAWSAH